VARLPASGLLLHFLNATGRQGKPQTEVVALSNILVRVRGRFNTVQSLVSGETITSAIDGGVTHFEIGRLGLYDGIVLRQEADG
jgi:hypothetical protein